jgi:hypothetical protein
MNHLRIIFILVDFHVIDKQNFLFVRIYIIEFDFLFDSLKAYEISKSIKQQFSHINSLFIQFLIISKVLKFESTSRAE